MKSLHSHLCWALCLLSSITLACPDYPQNPKTFYQDLYPIVRQVNLTTKHPIRPAIVLAQAALESGFGRAHLARKSCNIMGLWCYKKGCGIIPSRRDKGATHAIRRFPTIAANLTAYMYTLNTHAAYQTFRNRRHASLRSQVMALAPYAGIKDAYPKRLLKIITRDHLERFDVA